MASACQSFTVNPNTVTLTIPQSVPAGAAVTLSYTGFSITGACPTSYSVPTNTVVSLTYSSTGYNGFSTNLNIGTSNVTAPAVTLTGIPVIDIGQLTLSSGTVTLGNAVTVTIPVRNTGTAAFAGGSVGTLMVNGVSQGAINPGAVPAGGLVNVTMTVTPTAAGSFNVCIQ